MNNNHNNTPATTDIESPLKEGEFHCFECGQKGHIKPQCPKLKGKQRFARGQIEDVLDDNTPMDILIGEAYTSLLQVEDLNKYSEEEEDQPEGL